MIFLALIFFSTKLFAHDRKAVVHEDGFYVGVDQTLVNQNLGNIDKSVDKNSLIDTSKYYGYKVSEGGFFISPEVAPQNCAPTINLQGLGAGGSSAATQRSVQVGAAAINAAYNLRANIGYSFTDHVSGFLTYDVAQFSYNSAQGAISVNSNNGALNSSVLSFGSQIKVSDDFGIRVSYGQQNFQSTTVNGGTVRADSVKFGTVINF